MAPEDPEFRGRVTLAQPDHYPLRRDGGAMAGAMGAAGPVARGAWAPALLTICMAAGNAAELLPPVEVVAPLAGTAETLARTTSDRPRRPAGGDSVLSGLDARRGDVTLADPQGNPRQPVLLHRGFQASSALGAAPGLAVTLNGTRFNQPFGDAVLWDLLPDIAIERTGLEHGDPRLGPGALGGTLTLVTRTGFDWQGDRLALAGGSFGRLSGSLESGRRSGGTAAYLAVAGEREDGWRHASPSDVRQLFGSIGRRAEAGEAQLDLLLADTVLSHAGTTPVELLARDRAAVFTRPDETRNRYARVGLTLGRRIDDATRLEARLYLANLGQRTRNGDAGQAVRCDADGRLVCLEDGPVLTDRAGRPIAGRLGDPAYAGLAKFRDGGPYGFLNQTGLDSTGYGFALRAEHRATWLGRDHTMSAGVGHDGGVSGFGARTSLGTLDADRRWAGPGVVIEQADRAIAPVALAAHTDHLGLHAADRIGLTPQISLTLGGRLDLARVSLDDRQGGALGGRHEFIRFNPAAALDWNVGTGMLHAGYVEASRVPTPAELACASPAAPCSLTSFFVADPALKQVVARNWEIGWHGRTASPAGFDIDWHLGFFRSETEHEILRVAAPVSGRGYFENAGRIRRQGLEAGVAVEVGPWRAFADYAVNDAVFRTPLRLPGGDNPTATNGEQIVRPGARLPGIPAQVLKLGLEVMPAPGWRVGLSGRVIDGQWLLGDEANRSRPTAGYGVIDLDTEVRVVERVTLFGLVRNLTDARFATAGAFAPVGSTPILGAPGARDPRSLSPGAPRAMFGGLRVTF